MESSAASNNVLSAAQLIERSRSNSESTIQNARANKRMGNIFPRGEKLGTVDEVKTSKHHHVRGYSHDSIIETQRSTTNESVKEPAAPAQSPTEQEKQHAGHYFRRLSSLPEQKRTSLSSARVAESARGILYALAQSQSAISNFISSSGDRGRSKTLDRVLYSTNNQIGNLVQALENYDAREDETVVEPLLSACAFCIGAFRHVLSLLQSNLKELSSESDIRYTRTLLLMIYGSLNELMNSWAALRPALPPPPSSGFAPQPTSNFARQLGSPLPNMRLKSGSVASTTMTLAAAAVAAAQGIPPPLPTPRSPDPSFIVPSTPVISQTLYMSDLTGSENDETLFENVNHATSAALSTLPQITEAASKLALHQSLPPNTMIKLKELTVLCMSGRDVARRLRVRLDSIREVIRDNDIPERRRFWDDTNSFIKVSHTILNES